MKKYAGIGSRHTPQIVLQRMREYGAELAKQGYLLRSGGAPGADTAFEEGCDSVGGAKEIFIPWVGFNNRFDGICDITYEALRIAEQHHFRGWRYLGEPTQKLMARNVQQVLGQNLNDPVDFIICWTPNGSGAGGTGQAIRVAKSYDIKIYDLGTRFSCEGDI